MRVRAGALEDASGIATVHVRSWQAAYRGLLPQAFLDSMSTERPTEVWTRVLGTPGAVTVVEDEQGEIAGFVNHVACRDPDADESVGEVTTIYVLPEHFREGYGRALMDAATEALREAGFSQATLWVLADNARARRFYEIAGWSLDGASKDDEIGGQSITEVRYRRELR